MRWLVLPTLACAVVSVFLPAPAIRKELKVIKNYRKWKLVTHEPVDMSPQIAMLCKGPMPYDMSPNPHVPRVFLVFVNKTGEKAMFQQGATEFPDGSVIVKEKHVRPETVDWRKPTKAQILSQKPELLTVMVKENGSWSYYVVGEDGQVQDAEVKTCRGCHDVNKKTDYVFRTYLGETRSTTLRSH